MFSRIIIEQKLADLELALARQDELIKSQREVIRGLKDLISMEYQNAWQGNVSAVPPSAAAVLPPARAAHTTTTTSNSVVGNTKRSHDQVNHTSNVTTSTQRTSMSVQEAISSSVDSAKKRTKTDRDSTDSTSSSSSSSASKQPTTTTTTANIPTSSLSTPAHGQVPTRILAAPSPTMVVISSKKRRAMEKVKQLCTIIPRFSDIRYGISSSNPSNNASNTSAARRTPPPSNATIEANATFAPIPRIRKANNTYTDVLTKLQSMTTFDTRLEELKDLNTQLRIRTNETKKMLDAGGRAILFEWIAEIDTDKKPSKNAGIYLDYLVNLLDQSTWTTEQVVQTRYDKVLRKIYKKFSEYKDIMSPTLSSIVREAWNKYRLIYRNAVHEDEDD